ncbi:MAG: CHAT domain-containing protein, partial [Pirellulaceae bacterium]
YYVMHLGPNRYSFESTVQARGLERAINNLLKQINVGDKSAILEADLFASDEWRATAREISGLLFAKTDPKAMESVDEIIFIPDGKAWYLPMELLQVGTNEVSSNLNQQVRVRYAPMMSLAVPDERQSRRFRRSAIVAHRNFIRDDGDRIAAGRDEFIAGMPDTEQIEKTMQGTSNLLTSTIDQVTVWHDNKDNARGGPLSFAPLQLDQGKSGSGLDGWMMLPWRGVDQVILSGISSGIEGSSRTRADGSELFLASTAMMASGARTILVSRWRVGGQSTMDLTRELAQGLGKFPASEAWHRSLELFYETELDITAEPRIRDRVLDQPLKGDHPFFWSGYLLIDSGSAPATDDEAPAPVEVDENAGGTQAEDDK